MLPRPTPTTGLSAAHARSRIPRAGPLPRLCLCCLIALLVTGCPGRVSTQTIRHDLAGGNVRSLEKKLEETHESHGEFVTALNLARIYQMDGRWRDSIKSFEEALVILEDYERRAEINIRAMAAGIGTALLSRGAETYHGTGYERSLLHTFNALNYLMLGDFSGAAVEMRRMEKRQEFWLEESQARIEQYLETKEQVRSPEDLPTGYSMRDLLCDNEVRGLINNYQDPFSYSLGAILYRLAGDPQSADVGMRRAIALNDAALRMFSTAWPGPPPAGKKGAAAHPVMHPAVPPLPARFPENGEKRGSGKAPLPDTQEVTLIAFTGLSPALRVENIRFPFPAVGYVLIDLPSYVRPVSGVTPEAALLPLDTDAAGQLREIPLYPLLRTELLAYRTLWDEVRMELGFAVSRALARAGISASVHAAASSRRDTREYASLAATLTTLLVDFFATTMSESVRNWETLPNTGYLGLTHAPRGSSVSIRVGGAVRSLDLPPGAQGVIIMVTELSNANIKVNHVTY